LCLVVSFVVFHEIRLVLTPEASHKRARRIKGTRGLEVLLYQQQRIGVSAIQDVKYYYKAAKDRSFCDRRRKILLQGAIVNSISMGLTMFTLRASDTFPRHCCRVCCRRRFEDLVDRLARAIFILNCKTKAERRLASAMCTFSTHSYAPNTVCNISAPASGAQLSCQLFLRNGQVE